VEDLSSFGIRLNLEIHISQPYRTVRMKSVSFLVYMNMVLSALKNGLSIKKYVLIVTCPAP
jgi:hypothetical protein